MKKLPQEHNPRFSMPLRGIRGEMISFKSDPFINSPSKCLIHHKDGLIVISDGKIVAAGPYGETKRMFPDLTDVETWQDAVIMPGFIDCHTHYVQAPMIASPGDTLLNWLNRYTFPTEMKFSDRSFSDETARIFFRQLLSQGTTTANVFATTFEESVEALFSESEKYNLRTICGKVLQDRNIPSDLKDSSAEKSVSSSARLLEKWHGRGRQLYAVAPRFAPTSTPLQLRLAGDLYRAYVHSGVYMHTHLDEAENEIEWVKELFPDCRTYTGVYEKYGLLDRLSVFAHCCIVEEEEWKLLHGHRCGVAHCPSSNLFLGDGKFKYWEGKDPERPCKVGVGTDVGAGTNLSVLRQLGDAYKVAMLHDRYLSCVKGLYMATRGGAEVLGLEDKIGSITPGNEADLTVIDLRPNEFLSWRMEFEDDILNRLFVLQSAGGDNLVKATYVCGKKVYERDRETQFEYV